MAGKKKTYDNIKFDSGLELDHYKYIKQLDNIEILEVHPNFVLFDSFEWFDIQRGKISKYRKIGYTGDFLLKLPDREKLLVVESKGFQRADYMLRKKLFILKYKDEYDFIQLDNMKQCKDFFKQYIQEEE